MTKPTLSKRQKRILSTLSTHIGWVKGADLSRVLGVSDRTIRTDMDGIKSILGDSIILTSHHYGYRLNPDIDLSTISIAQYDDYQERMALMLKALVLNEDGVNLFDLSNDLMVAESTLLSDIQQLRKFLQNQKGELTINRQVDMLVLTGTRFTRVQSLIHWIKDELNYMTTDQFQSLFPEIDVPRIYEMLLEQLVEEKYFSRYLSFRSLLITVLLVCELSIQGGRDDPMELKQTTESSLVVKILQGIEEVLHTRVMTQDIDLINETLSSVKAMEEVKGTSYSTDILTDQTFLNLRVILQEVKQRYELDFTHETELAVDLTTHVKVAMLRIAKGIHITNPIIEQMKTDYPFLFDVALYMGYRLSELTGVTFHPDEISFIVCHLADTYESLHRSNTVQDKLRIMLIAREGKSVAKYVLMNNEMLKQDSSIDLTVISSDVELEAIMQSEVTHDLIFSTSTIKLGNRLPDLIILPAVSAGDRFAIRALINRAMDTLKKRNYNTLDRLFFSRSQFFDMLDVSTAFECINHLCASLKRAGHTDDQFEQSVIERETLIATAMQTGIALPHATMVYAQRTSVAVATLKKPIDWGHYKVSVVMLFAIAKDDIKYLNYFYVIVSRFAVNPINIQRLSQCSNMDDVIALFYDDYLKNLR